MPYIGTGRISLFFEVAGVGGVAALVLDELGGTAKASTQSSRSWRPTAT